MGLSFSSLTLSASFIACIYLVLRASTPPNPAPPKDKRWKKDTFMVHQGNRRRTIGLALVFSGCFYHTLLIFLPFTSPSIFCPHPDHLDPKLFTWSPYTIFFVVLVFVAAPIRLLAYSQLGPNFTYQLAKPQGLVKTGLYRYVRHPSYPTLFACHAATAALFLRTGGIAGCFEPDWVVNAKIRGVGVDVWFWVVAGLAMVRLLGVRVREEEEMLRSEFKMEYEEYSKRTWKVLPGII